MNSVGIRELRQNASAVLRRVVAGEVVDVTDHGHPIARIVPLRHRTLDQLVLEGRATPATADLLDVMEQMRMPVRARRGRPGLSETLTAMRDDAR